MPHLNTPTKNGGEGRNLLIKPNFSLKKKKSSQISSKPTTPNTLSNNQERIIHPGFTLVELIIVITILAILATIAFISFQNYTKSARDASRTTTLKNLETGLSLLEVKDGKYPTPDDETIYSGGTNQKVKITQGVIGENISSLIGLTHIPSDPRNPTLKYNYSTFGENNQYYQIGINSENTQISFLPLLPITYAQETKTPLIRGNYLFDPSLPSLFFIPSTQGTDLFHPKNCFILEGGPNTFQSNESDCIKKEEMSLKYYDPSLVGYWNMETITPDGKLKDLSGNENEGSFSGMIYQEALTGGLVGQGMNMNGSTNFIVLNNVTDISQFKTINTIVYIPENIDFSENSWGKAIVHTSGGSYQSFELRIGSDYSVIFQIGDGIDWRKVTSKDTMSSGYHNITGVYDHVNRKILLYIDGYLNQYVKLSLDSGLPKNGLTTPLRIGGNSGGNSKRNFYGIIDDVKIYNRVLSDQEILQQAKVAGL